MSGDDGIGEALDRVASASAASVAMALERCIYFYLRKWRTIGEEGVWVGL